MEEHSKTDISLDVADKIEFLKRLIICHADLQTSLSAITFLNEADRSENYDVIQMRRFKCYETSFVIAYGRAFTNSNGLRHSLLSLNKIGLKLSDDESALHRKILDYRHKKYAHSDLSKAHGRIDLFIDEIHGKEHPVYHVQWDEGLDFIEHLELYRILDLIGKIMEHLLKTTRQLAYELKEHLPISITPDGGSKS